MNITITTNRPDIFDFDDTDDAINTEITRNRKTVSDANWVYACDICATCPNRPGGPNNKNGMSVCMCTLPNMYGPFRVTC